MALRVLREMIRCHPEPFYAYAELTILKLLEAHKDPVKEVLVNCTLLIVNSDYRGALSLRSLP